MKKLLYALFLVVLLLVALNPSLQDHKEAMRAVLYKDVAAKTDTTETEEAMKAYKKAMLSVGAERADIEIGTSVSRKNFFLFSLTKYRDKDQNISTVGYGVLGRVKITKAFTPNP